MTYSNSEKTCAACGAAPRMSQRVARCADCQRAYRRSLYLDNREKILARNRAYQKSHSPNTRNRAYYLAHREELCAKSKAYREAHKEEQRAKKQAYLKAHRREVAAQQLAWVEANPEKFKQIRNAAVAKYRQKHPHLHAEIQARRSARKRGATVEPVNRQAIIERDKSICYLCSRKLEKHEITIDHVIPLARSGPHSAANLRVACGPCNFKKQTKLLHELPLQQTFSF